MLEIYNYQEIVAKAKAFFVMCDPVDDDYIWSYAWDFIGKIEFEEVY